MDSSYLKIALELARKRRGSCSPNPSVGAVAVRDGQIMGQGFHWAPGSPHAEVEALRALPENLADVTLYVTLEPCCHHGRTPPCTELILKRGIRRVVFGYEDPNPIVAGNGRAALETAG